MHAQMLQFFPYCCGKLKVPPTHVLCQVVGVLLQYLFWIWWAFSPILIILFCIIKSTYWITICYYDLSSIKRIDKWIYYNVFHVKRRIAERCFTGCINHAYLISVYFKYVSLALENPLVMFHQLLVIWSRYIMIACLEVWWAKCEEWMSVCMLCERLVATPIWGCQPGICMYD